MTFKIENTEYRIEFRHINRATQWGGKKLRKTGGFKGITTCVVVFLDTMSKRDNLVVAIETVLCSEGDQFSKEGGRVNSLKLALVNCVRIPRAHIEPILQAYKTRNEVALPHPDEVNHVQEVPSVQRAG